MCYKCFAYESKMAAIFNSGQFSGLPTELPTISILESSVLPTELPTELPTISVYGSSGQSNLHGKIPMGSPWAAHSTANWAALFSYFEVVGCPLSCPLFLYMEVVGSLICMAKFPWPAHGQPTPLPSELPTFLIFGSSGLPTELPTVFIYGSSGQPYLHGKIPIGSPWAANSVAHVQPMGSEVGSSPVFPYGQFLKGVFFAQGESRGKKTRKKSIRNFDVHSIPKIQYSIFFSNS